MAYYRVDIEYMEQDEFYIKAKSKKEAVEKAKKDSYYGYIESISAEKITKKEYEKWKI